MRPTPEDRAFIEHGMFHGRGSRQPVRRLLSRLVPPLALLGIGVSVMRGSATSGRPEAALFEMPGGLGLVYGYTLFGIAICIGGLVMLGLAVRAYRSERATARRARSMSEG